MSVIVGAAEGTGCICYFWFTAKSRINNPWFCIQLAGVGSDAAELIQPVCAAVLGSTHWYGSSHKDVFVGLGWPDLHVCSQNVPNPLSSRHLSWQGLFSYSGLPKHQT